MSDFFGGLLAFIIAASWAIIIFFGSIGLAISSVYFCFEQIARLFS